MTAARSYFLSGIAAMLLGAAVASAQTPVPAADASRGSAHSVSISVGTFNYDAGGERYYPLVVLRGDRELSRFFLVEAGIGYAAAETWTVDEDPPQTARTPLVVSDVSLQFQFAIGPIRPYLGVGVGLVGRVAGEEPGERFVRPSYAGGGGIRVDISPRLGARADLRVRLDEHPGFTAFDYEQTVGFAVRF